MNPHSLDFSARLARRSAPAQRLVAISVLALALAGFGLAIGLQQGRQVRELESLLAERNQAEASLRLVTSRQDNLNPDAADAINGVIRLMSYPLIATLDNLERHMQDDVKLMTVEAGPVRANLRLIVQAENLPRVLDYMEALQSEAGLAQIALVRQESSLEARTARFTLEQPQGGSLLRAAPVAAHPGARP